MTATGPPPRIPVDEVDAGVLRDEQTFRRDVAEPCRPAVFRSAFSDWPVVRAAGASPAELRTYLGQFASEVPAEAFVGASSIAGRYTYTDDLEGFNFERVQIDLEAALDRILAAAAAPGSPTVYVGSLETEIHLPGFAAENQVAALPPSVGPRIWIGNASDVSCHNDTFDNLACVIAGKRRFTLYPPAAIADLYVGPIDFTMAGRPVGLAAGSSRGDTRYPRFEQWRDQAAIVELEPGDALYLPKLWWHQVEATEPFNVLVNYWWDAFRQGPDEPSLTMMLAMIAIAERPTAERGAWRALFDHYVFRSAGHPLAHLPPERHGILGPVRANYGRIRARVMQALRGG